MKLAAKEEEETQYGFMLCQYSAKLTDCGLLRDQLTEIKKILGAIIGSAKRKWPVSYLFSLFI